MAKLDNVQGSNQPKSGRHRRPAPKKPQKPLAKLLALAVAHATRLSLALLLAAALAPLALPALERKLDFEESGPLAGSARPTIRTAPGAEARFDAASRAAEGLLDAHRDGGGPSAFFAGLARELESRGLEVARLTEWRADWPYGRRRGRRCAALHAVLRAPRGDGKESVAIVTPVALQPRPRALARQGRADAALALAAAHALVAGHLRDAAPWLAKDVVWIVPDASCGGVEAVEAWLTAYHQEEAGAGGGGGRGRAPAATAERGGHGSGDGNGDAYSSLRRRPFVRAGIIQQAFVLQSESLPPAAGGLNNNNNNNNTPPPFAASIALVGADGQLPKTDFYWLARYYCSKWVRLPGCAPPGYPAAPPGGKASSGEDGPLLRAAAAAAEAAARLLGEDAAAAAERVRAYARRLGLVLRFAAQQARGVPTGPHAPFKWRNTDALTLDFAGAAPAEWGGQDASSTLQHHRARQAAELLELSVRSCSVLVERLHHAFFLYVLSSPDHFVSVERYIGPVCALIGILFLQAAAARRAIGGGGEEGGAGEEGEEEQGGDAGISASSWAASARVAALLPLLCGALGWSLRAGLEAASLARGGGAGGWSAALERAAAVAAAAAAAAQRWAGVSSSSQAGSPGDADELGPGYAAAEALRLGAAAAAVAVLAWAGLAEGRAALEALLLRGARGGRGMRMRRKGGEAGRRAASASPPVDWRMLKVLALCGAAVPLAGMACANWALAHAAALACAPLAFAVPSSSSSRAAAPGSAAAARLRVAAVVLCSPVGLAALAALGTVAVAGLDAGAWWWWWWWPAGRTSWGGVGSAAGDAARWLVLEGTSWTTWSFAWCVYAPLWAASAWIVSLPCC
jgi:glycosylphosphatidylinositol transamidase